MMAGNITPQNPTPTSKTQASSSVDNQDQGLIRDVKPSSSGILLPIMSIVTAIILIFLVVAFFKGWTFNFYANILFGFYALTKQVWVSVVFLGVVQTIIMIPFRAVRVMQSQHIQKFQDKITELNQEQQQISKVKKTFRRGNLTFLFYLIDFMVQLILFISIGRLFLTDFYNKKLASDVLLNFIPYPDYPLQGLMFKLPYPIFKNTRDFGWWVVFGVWFLILVGHVLFYVFKRVSRRVKARQEHQQKQDEAEQATDIAEATKPKSREGGAKQVFKYLGGSTVILFVVSYFLIRNFPSAISVEIFSGDVSIPNRTLNTVTAIVTFLMFAWFGLQDILRQGKLADEEGVPEEVVELTQKEMFRSTLLNSALIGLGAFLITNQIPSAFELSIFTFEVIAIFSPMTIDKFVLKIGKG